MVVKKGNINMFMTGGEMHLNLYRDKEGNFYLSGALLDSQSKDIFQIIKMPIIPEPVAEDEYEHYNVDGTDFDIMPQRQTPFIIRGLTVLRNIEMMPPEMMNHS